jgi:hypothetical protein
MMTFDTPLRTHSPVAASDDQTDFVMLVGPDQSGNLIEVGIVVTDDIEYAVHAMRARNQYLEWL